MSKKTMHLRLSHADLNGAHLAIVPGDPGRVERIARMCSHARQLSEHREYHAWVAELSGKSVIICSTGIGGPATSICIEELAQLGVRDFIRIGTTGAIQPHIAVGDMVITQASVRLDGASYHFVPPEFPAVADHFMTNTLVEAAKFLNLTWHVGITASSDTFYPGQERYDTYRGVVLPRFENSLKLWQQLGVLNYEMETATLFCQARALGLHAASILGVIAQRTSSESIEEAQIQETERRAISVGVKAAQLYLG